MKLLCVIKVLCKQTEKILCMIPCYGPHGSRQRINNNLIQEEYKIWVLIAETYGYVFRFRSYPGTKKGKQVASSAKWELWENFVFQLQSFDIFTDNYFTSFCLLTHVGANNVRATAALNKKRLRKCTITRDKPLQKKERDHFEQHTSSKKAVKILYSDFLGWV